jgi:hypothetical protein
MNYGKYNPYESGDVEIISENEDLKIVKVLTKDAAFYFGGDFYSQNWDNNFSEGDIYFIISSNEDIPIVSLHNREDNEPSVVRTGYDSNRFGNADDLKKLFPESLKLLSPLIIFGKTFEFLKSIYSGYEPRWNENGGDKIISDIKFNSKTPNSSIVVIEFNDDEDFLNVFDLDSDDQYEWRYYMSDYSSGDYDLYNYNEDWDEGNFIEYAFNDENRERLYNIVKVFFPSTPNENIRITTSMTEIDSDFVESVIYEYGSEWQNCIFYKIKDDIRSELENPFIKFGIKEKSFAFKYETTVGVLLTWYKQLKFELGDIGELLKELIEKFDQNKNNYRGSWSELRYNTDCDSFDYDAYQTYVSNRLDGLIEKYEEDERFINFYEFIDLQQQIDQEYGFNKWIPLKTNKNAFFNVEKIDPETNKIIVKFKNNERDNSEEKRILTHDQLKKLETQYELFEQKRKRFGKLR